jgi:hypothetical protein
MCFSAFVVKGVESRQTNVGDFFLRQSDCRVRRQSVARRTNGRSGRAARQRQRPSDSQYRYGCPTLSLRISLAMRHGGGFPFHPHLNVPLYTNDGHKAVSERWIGTCGAGGSPNVRFTPKKRTCGIESVMSALCQKRTHALQQSVARMGLLTQPPPGAQRSPEV